MSLKWILYYYFSFYCFVLLFFYFLILYATMIVITNTQRKSQRPTKSAIQHYIYNFVHHCRTRSLKFRLFSSPWRSIFIIRDLYIKRVHRLRLFLDSNYLTVYILLWYACYKLVGFISSFSFSSSSTSTHKTGWTIPLWQKQPLILYIHSTLIAMHES